MKLQHWYTGKLADAHVRNIKHAHFSVNFDASTSATQAPIDLDPTPLAEDEFIAEAIVDERKHKGRTEHRVRWQGYPASNDTWEPVENLQNGKGIKSLALILWIQRRRRDVA